MDVADPLTGAAGDGKAGPSGNSPMTSANSSTDPSWDDSARLLTELQNAVRERDAALAAMREREAELLLALKAGRMGTWNWSPNSGSLHWTVELETIHGLSLGSFSGTFDAFLALIHPRDRNRVVEEFQSALVSAEKFTMEYRVVWPDGSLHWIAGDGQVFRDAAGRPIQMLGIGYEITGRKQAEERQRLRAEVSRALDGAGLDEVRVLVAIGEVLQEILGAEITIQLLDENGEFLRPVVVLDRDVERARRRENLLRDTPLRVGEGIGGMVVATGVPLLLENFDSESASALTKPEYRPHIAPMRRGSLAAVSMRAHGRTVGSLTVTGRDSDLRYNHDDVRLFQEIADQAALAVMNVRLFEAERRAHAQTESALHLRDEFLAIAAHELKTPMTSIRGHAQLLQRIFTRTGSLPTDLLTRSIGAIDRETAKLSRLIEQLLDVSRIERGRLSVTPAPTDLNDLIAGVVAAFQSQTTKHTLDFRASEPVVCPVDPLRFEQIVRNLVDNAIKYSPDGGPVWLDLGRDRSGRVVLAVTDRGLGIPEEHRGKIFERFYQAHAQSYQSGLGLGLAITREIIDLHGGEIHAEFPPEGGTRFVVRLPSSLHRY